MSYWRTETVAVVRIIASIGRFVSSIPSIVSMSLFGRSSKWNSRGSRTSACYRDKLFNILGERWTLIGWRISADISGAARGIGRSVTSISIRPVSTISTITVSFSNDKCQKARKDCKSFHDSLPNADGKMKILGLYRLQKVNI